MKNFASRLLLAFFLLVPVAAFAQSTGTVVADCTTGVGLAYTPGSTRPMTLLPTGQACITGSISASLSGFTAASTGTPISVTTGGVTGNLPAGTVVVATNVGSTNGAYCALGASATTASQYIAPNGGWFAFTVGASTQLTCITSTSTTTVNMTGGAGLPTGTGGGGGGGSGGAVTVADGADVTQGAIADAAATAGSTGTVSAKLRLMTSQLDNINTNIQAGSGAMGSAVPSSGIYVGGNVAGTLRGWTGVNPSGSVYAQQTDVTSVNGVTASTGTGAVGTGTQRVAVGTDTATVAGTAPATAGIAATGAAPPAGSIQVAAVASGATGGLMAGLKTCDLHAVYDASDNGSKEMIAAVSGRTIYICGFIMATGGTATNLKLVDGTGTDCATGTPTNLTPAYQLVANDKIGANSAFWNGLKASNTNRAVCVNASAGNAHQAEIWYTIQ
jgi:hypothetical protein